MRTALFLGALLSALSCSAPSSTGPAPAPPAARPPAAQKRTPVDIAKLEKLVHDRVNKERMKRGLPARRWDAALCSIARSHSRDMAKRNYFSHTSPSGQGYQKRYMQAGYACGITVNGVLRRGGENILRILPEGTDDLAAAALREWTAGARDRENLF